MKIRFHIMPLVAMLALVSACEKDNYTEPKSVLSGKIVYKGEPGPFGFHPEEVESWLAERFPA